MTSELDKVYNDSVRARNEAMQAKNNLNQSYLSNVGNALNEGTNLGFMVDYLKKTNPADLMAALRKAQGQKIGNQIQGALPGILSGLNP